MQEEPSNAVYKRSEAVLGDVHNDLRKKDGLNVYSRVGYHFFIFRAP